MLPQEEGKKKRMMPTMTGLEPAIFDLGGQRVTKFPS